MFSRLVNAADADSLIWGKFDATSKTARTEVARDLLTTVSRFADFVPAPRPSDVSWVDAERAAIDRLGGSEARFSRSEQFYMAPEFQNVKLYNTLQQVKSAIACVLQSKVPLQHEMFCWATASFLLGDSSMYSDGIDILHRSNRLPQKVGVSQVLYESFSRGIQEYLILPYLKGDLK